MRFAGRVVSWRLKAPDTPDTPPAPGSLHRFYHKPGVSELAVKTAPGWRLSPPRSRPTPTPVRQDSACAGRLRGPQAIQARLQPPARLPPDPRFLVEPHSGLSLAWAWWMRYAKARSAGWRFACHARPGGYMPNQAPHAESIRPSEQQQIEAIQAPSYFDTRWQLVNRALALTDRRTHGHAGLIQRLASYLVIGGTAALVNLSILAIFFHFGSEKILWYWL